MPLLQYVLCALSVVLGLGSAYYAFLCRTSLGGLESTLRAVEKANREQAYELRAAKIELSRLRAIHAGWAAQREDGPH